MEINVHGTATGRISSRELTKSNKPKPGKLTANSGEPQLMGSFHDSEAEPGPTFPELCGMHLGPRSKHSHPYNYDPLLVFRSAKLPNGSAYSDRLLSWYDYAVVRAKMQKHFGEQGDYYSGRSVSAIQAFLRDLMNKPDLEITRIEEHCNQSTGYPVWYFAFRATEATVADTPSAKP